ncbi:hypothetical protein [Flavobacterium sp.]|uniref:hypothetical protein n=1 Tax=Flavobacterium sp. TaxID=239 RepID=UPI00262E97B8|nr:hypothetical protein [Flavobacterium sp.]
MSPEEFDKNLKITATALRNYANNRYPTVAGNIALRFINGNFRAGGYQGSSFKKWKTKLIDTGALRSDNTYTTQVAQVTLKNNRPYAKAHNEGYEGTVSVKAHTRNSYSKTKVGTGKFTKKGKERTKTLTTKSGESKVKAHSRKIKIPQSQFMPIKDGDSPVLKNAITRAVSRDIKELINK